MGGGGGHSPWDHTIHGEGRGPLALGTHTIHGGVGGATRPETLDHIWPFGALEPPYSPLREPCRALWSLMEPYEALWKPYVEP